MQMQVQMRMQIYIIELQKISFLGVTSRGIMDENCRGTVRAEVLLKM